MSTQLKCYNVTLTICILRECVSMYIKYGAYNYYTIVSKTYAGLLHIYAYVNDVVHVIMCKDCVGRLMCSMVKLF